MIRLAVIADDITGANATGILLRKKGWRIATLLDHRAPLDSLSSWDGIVWNADSRLLPSREAGKRVGGMARRIRSLPAGDELQLAKRIDSTLRGAVGAEIEAILGACPAGAVAAVVPAFPASGRITRGGTLFVHGVPVHQTEIGQDPYSPVHTSDVAQLIQAQTSLPVGWVETGRSPHLKEALAGAVRKGAKIVVCDAESDPEIQALAEAWASLEIPLLPVDPGPFTAAYITAKAALQKRLLLISGSLAPTTREQLEMVQTACSPGIIDVDLNRLVRNFDEAVRQIDDRMDRLLKAHPILLLRTDRIPYAGPNPASVLARAVRRWLTSRPFDGLFLSGGDVAAAVLREIGTETMELLEEVVPLAVMARIVGGPLAGIKIVTKGGAVGDREAIVTCIRSLLETSPSPRNQSYMIQEEWR
jgi:D-threonate/D-erythronate kinase